MPALRRAKTALKQVLSKRPKMEERVKDYKTRKKELTSKITKCSLEHDAAKRFMINPRYRKKR